MLSSLFSWQGHNSILRLLILRLLCFFYIVYCKENRLPLNITPFGENLFITLLTEIKFEIWRVTSFKSFLPLRNCGMVFQFSENNGNIIGKELNVFFFLCSSSSRASCDCPTQTWTSFRRSSDYILGVYSIPCDRFPFIPC